MRLWLVLGGSDGPKRQRVLCFGVRVINFEASELSVQFWIPRYYRCIVNPRKLEHRFRMIHAGIPFTLL